MTSLKLAVDKEPFEVMITGEKVIEYRRACPWIESRLNKNHRFIEVTNGYGQGRPFFKAEIKKVYAVDEVNVEFSNGLKVNAAERTYCIEFGDIIEKRNY